MRLSVATNFDDGLIDQVRQFPVGELYGKLPSDIIGGGRSSYMLGPLSRRRLERHVGYARKQGIGFNYLLNASCLDNLETTRRGQRGLRKLLDWVSDIGATAVTLSNPLLLRIVKRNYSHLNVRVSVFAGVDHLQRARYWEEQGADVIALDSLTVNREFRTLRQLRKGLSCDLELLVNNNCLQSCSLSQTHMNLLAHSSQAQHVTGGFVIDHCLLECSRMKVSDPVNYLRSDWIRPEDLHLYEEMGFTRFKLTERGMPTPLMVQRVKAYAERRFDGNLIDLIQPYGHQKKHTEDSTVGRHKTLWALSFLFRPGKVNPARLKGVRQLVETKGMVRGIDGEAPVHIDNRALDGFAERFRKAGCREVDCERCRHCHRYAERAVRVDPDYRQECMRLHGEIDASLETGALWSYKPVRQSTSLPA